MENILNHITIFEGSLEDLKTGVVKKGIGDLMWNRNLFVPLDNNSKIYVHPDQEGISGMYIRVIHSDYNCVSVFNKSYFSLD
jgi:hypothetical protein